MREAVHVHGGPYAWTPSQDDFVEIGSEPNVSTRGAAEHRQAASPERRRSSNVWAQTRIRWTRRQSCRRAAPRPRGCLQNFLFFTCAPHLVGAWWPFEDGEGKGKQPGADGPKIEFHRVEGVPVEMMGMFRPVVMMQGQGHFGFDPWEDLHSNVQRVVHQSVQQPQLLQAGGLGGGVLDKPADGQENSGALAVPGSGAPLELQLGNLLDIFGGQHSGHVGRASGSFDVDDDHTRFRLTALLPGYKLGGEGSNDPLNVRVVGRRSLVVSGTHKNGFMMSTWQRSFSLPRHSDIEHVSVTYNATDGNLTVAIPRRNGTDARSESEADEGQDDEDALMPPALRAMRSGLPGIVGHMSSLPARQQAQRSGGFMAPSLDIGDVLSEVFGMMNQMHPRFQPPPGGDQPVPEDTPVNLVGCFSESQLSQAELKYYGEGNGASFNAMFWHANSDHVPYFAMSRHAETLGHAFTFRNFTHTDETPEWGVYDGCGSPCADDGDRWCGCSNEASRGFPNPECTEGEKRFAVYKVGNRVASSNESDDMAQATDAADPAGTSEGTANHNRPFWQLSSGNESAPPELEIVVPKGQVGQARGRDLLLFNASDSGSDPTKQDPTSPPTDAPQEVNAADSTQKASDQPATEAVGKVRLPVDVGDEACEVDWSKTREDGAQTIKCKLERSDVKSLPIKVVGDEL